ncbi:membrane protein [Hoeflea sp. BAL378]|uniref:membrane protein n=1 Tax=Hoeflea sp. BAL378 TaxID=1547437 RepID=UPI000514238C|nr:membrane protein [Hoeflea sp. BAL378]KGF66969.1 membrane protein [Hoeflea sp. BAL378]
MTLGFDPFLPLPFLLAIAAVAVLLVGWAILKRMRGAALRALALAALVLALANPVANFEDREPVTSVVAVVVDKSPSQMGPDRRARTDAALAALTERLARYPAFETRIIEAVTDPDAQSPSTRLFEALASGIRDVPSSRLAGAVMITDGQVHDVPDSLAGLGLDAPLHGLIVGDEGEVDRRVDVVRSPRFGIVGEDQEIVYRVNEDGAASPGPVSVTVRVNGEEVSTESAMSGEESSFYLNLPRGGENIIEFAVDPLAGEVTTANNHAVTLIEGIRENLRVLLVSGAPHAGERAWRNLLKSDASVDLVHFTILRPPEKQDGTPISELSLIAFPTRELFVEKIDEFDLIIFDRYQNRGVLPVLYYDYIAQYVEDGGALLVAAGPELAGMESIAETPLAPALPAMPTGEITDAGYYPRLSDDGKRHPVTRTLPGGESEPPAWGRWFRTVGVGDTVGDTVMRGSDGAPLLVLNRYGEGRVAMLLSDHGWLWARGFEGGGPHVALYRRIAHWLMKEPSLEEEALRATAKGRTLVVERQTMGDAADPATITLPSGETRELVLSQAEDGLFRAELTLDEPGLVEVTSGDLRALAHVGAVDAPEFRATVSTTEVIGPVSEESGGLTVRVNAEASNLPQILPTRSASVNAGDRMGLRASNESVLKGVRSLPLFGGFLGLALLILALGATWFREGR